MLFQVNLALFLYVLTFPLPACNHLPGNVQGWSDDITSVLDHKHGLGHGFETKLGLLILGRFMLISEERLYSCLVPAVLSV